MSYGVSKSTKQKRELDRVCDYPLLLISYVASGNLGSKQLTERCKDVVGCCLPVFFLRSCMQVNLQYLEMNSMIQGLT